MDNIQNSFLCYLILWGERDSNPLRFLSTRLCLERCTISRYFHYSQAIIFLNGFFHYYSLAQLHLRCRLPNFFNLKYVKDHILKIRCKYTNNFLIFQIFFNIFFSHEKRNRTFITTIITTARCFTIKLPHGVILLTFMTSMQRRGLEPLHPVFTTGALTY